MKSRTRRTAIGTAVALVALSAAAALALAAPIVGTNGPDTLTGTDGPDRICCACRQRRDRRQGRA